jgi:hypothetical protein
MSRTRFPGVDLDDLRRTLSAPAQQWPDDCPTCHARMEFDLSGADPVRRCVCGVRVHFRRGEFITL